MVTKRLGFAAHLLVMSIVLAVYAAAAGQERSGSDVTGEPPSGALDGVPQASINTGRITAHPSKTFRGWGMSLAWEAHDLYGGQRQAARIKDPALQSHYMDLLYGDPGSRLTLGFSIARYNIAGGDDPTHVHMRPDAQLEGYQSGAGAPFDWSRDAPQRRMLQEAKKRGASLFEAAAYSPPYWMTVSGCSSGSQRAQQDNLRPEMRSDFVNYLVTVVKHFRDVEGIDFESLEPFNEPDGSWRTGGSQEGYSAPVDTQNVMLPMLQARLKHDGVRTFVAGVDTNNVAAAVDDVGKLTPTALNALGRLNMHDYHSLVGDLAKLREYSEVAQKLHKPVWMSELGCCFRDQKEKDEMWGALFMADSIRMDLRDLGAEAWVLWQPDWEVIGFDPQGGAPILKKQYYAIAQYTRFIRPGFQIISAGGAYDTLAAYSTASKRLVLVTTNSTDTPGEDHLDLAAFTGVPSLASVYRTTAEPATNLREETLELRGDGDLVSSLPPRSITTYVIDGLSPRLSSTSHPVEGTHKVVSLATHQCLNIAGNATSSGAAVIPYSCVAFSNETFNFVDRGERYYSIHTVNDQPGLCLNVSNGTTSPGDGETRAGPGNLIQWSCVGVKLPANELFEMAPAGSGSYWIRPQSSHLCLEDPGRGGTIRQNRCDPKAANQKFMLID